MVTSHEKSYPYIRFGLTLKQRYQLNTVESLRRRRSTFINITNKEKVDFNRSMNINKYREKILKVCIT